MYEWLRIWKETIWISTTIFSRYPPLNYEERHNNTDHDNCNPLLPNKKIEPCNFQAQTRNVTATSTPHLIIQRTDTALCQCSYTHGFGLPPRGKRDLRYLGMLRIFNAEAVLVCLTWTAWTFQMGPIGCLETSAPKYQSTMPNIPQERRIQVYKHFIFF